MNELGELELDKGLLSVPYNYLMDGRCFSLCLPNRCDAEVMARSISASGEAPLISSEHASEISPEIVEGWWRLAEIALVVRVNGETVAMGTLSIREAQLAAETVELCHLFVVPEYRRQYNGSHLVQEIMWIVRRSRFKRVIGRMVQNNYIAQTFFKSLRWSVTQSPESIKGKPFIWYERVV